MKKSHLNIIIGAIIWLAAIFSILIVSNFAIFKKSTNSCPLCTISNSIPIHRELTAEEVKRQQALSEKKRIFLSGLSKEVIGKLQNDEYYLFLTDDGHFIIKDAKTNRVILEEKD